MKKNRNIYLAIVVFVLISISVTAYALSTQKTSTYNGTATVVEAPSFKKVVIEIKDDENNAIGKADVYSNVFGVGDKVKVEYTKKGKNLDINKIESIANTTEEKAKVVNHISSDVTIRKYREMMKGTVDISQKEGSKGETMNLDHLQALPEKISGQYYTKTVTPSEYFYIKNYGYDGIFASTEKDLSITITGTDNFTILSLKNIHDDETIEEVTYNFNDKSFKLTALGAGIYVAQVEFENGDIINYIFI